MASQKGGIKKGEKEREKKKKRERKKRNEKLSIQKLNSSAGKRRKKLEKKFPLGKITCRRMRRGTRIAFAFDGFKQCSLVLVPRPD